MQELAGRAGLPMPRVYIIDSAQPNAFATGRNPEHAAVAASTGLLNMMSREEVAGVMAHELAHIKNRDTLIMTITATIAGAISMLAQFGMFFGGNRENNNGGMGIIGTLAMVILAPIAAMLVQMAISRTREYSADRLGARDRRRAALARRRARPHGECRAPDPERAGRGESRDRAHVHHQPALGPADGQPVLDASGDARTASRRSSSSPPRWGARAVAISRRQRRAVHARLRRAVPGAGNAPRRGPWG